MTDAETTTTTPERKVRLARLSGKATAAWLVAAFFLAGLVIPSFLPFRLWIDVEIVLGVWWLVWLIVLTRMLYMGQRVSADHQLGAPRNWLAKAPEEKKDPLDIRKKPSRSSSGWWDFFYFSPGPVDGEGCLVLLGIIIGVILLVGFVWFLIEIAIPVVAFLLYVAVRGMLAHVINDRHRCRGSLVPALAWAFVWATAYTAPLALVVWFVHYANGLRP
jgi:hypothetical protein